MPVSDAKIRSIKSYGKSFKLTDSQGPYLPVNSGGSRLWYLKYRFNRKKSRIAVSVKAVPRDSGNTNMGFYAGTPDFSVIPV